MCSEDRLVTRGLVEGRTRRFLREMETYRRESELCAVAYDSFVPREISPAATGVNKNSRLVRSQIPPHSAPRAYWVTDWLSDCRELRATSHPAWVHTRSHCVERQRARRLARSRGWSPWGASVGQSERASHHRTTEQTLLDDFPALYREPFRGACCLDVSVSLCRLSRISYETFFYSSRRILISRSLFFPASMNNLGSRQTQKFRVASPWILSSVQVTEVLMELLVARLRVDQVLSDPAGCALGTEICDKTSLREKWCARRSVNIFFPFSAFEVQRAWLYSDTIFQMFSTPFLTAPK